MKGGNKIAFNAIILYGKMLFSIGVGLYTTRVILEVLGASDYGIFNVIAGLISLLSLLNTTMATSSQRHISYCLGNNNVSKLKNIFASSILIHIVLGIGLIFIFEIVGNYLISHQLKIENNRIAASKILFQFVIISTFVTIISVPYDALINAHENMLFLSIVSVIEIMLKLCIAFLLQYLKGDKLIYYGLMLMIVTLLIRIIKQYYCKITYPESKVSKNDVSKSSIYDLFSFASWNLLGVLTFIFKNQGIGVVLNLFFATIINAAYGIASQVNGQLSIFSGVMIQSIEPQMIKSEGAGNRDRLIMLSIFASKYAFFLFTLFSLPIFLQLHWILGLWLKVVPENTVTFCRLIIILTSIVQLYVGITISAHAIGNIKRYQLYNIPLQLVSLPLGYLVLKLNYPAYSILYVYIVIEILTLMSCILFFFKSTNCSIWTYFQGTFLKCLFPLIFSFTIYFLLVPFISSYRYSNLPLIGIFFISYLSIFYFLGTTLAEKLKMKSLVENTILKVVKSLK